MPTVFADAAFRICCWGSMRTTRRCWREAPSIRQPMARRCAVPQLSRDSGRQLRRDGATLPAHVCTTRRPETGESDRPAVAPQADSSFPSVLAQSELPGLAVRLSGGDWPDRRRRCHNGFRPLAGNLELPGRHGLRWPHRDRARRCADRQHAPGHRHRQHRRGFGNNPAWPRGTGQLLTGRRWWRTS